MPTSSLSFAKSTKFRATINYQVVLHAGHELPHVAHDDVRRRFLALLGALDEILDVLGEGGGAIGG